MLQAISTATTSGLIQSRWAAIVHVSIFDAVNSFTGDAEPYRGMQVSRRAGATVEAAVIAAAHYALVHLLPDQQSALDTQYASSLAARRLTTSDPGIEVGEKAAAQVLALRANDGSATAQFPYTAPGSGNPGRMGSHASRICAGSPAGLGKRSTVGHEEPISIPRGSSAGAQQRAIRDGCQ